jgi:hypothetical protein
VEDLCFENCVFTKKGCFETAPFKSTRAICWSSIHHCEEICGERVNYLKEWFKNESFTAAADDCIDFSYHSRNALHVTHTV